MLIISYDREELYEVEELQDRSCGGAEGLHPLFCSALQFALRLGFLPSLAGRMRKEVNIWLPRLAFAFSPLCADPKAVVKGPRTIQTTTGACSAVPCVRQRVFPLWVSRQRSALRLERGSPGSHVHGVRGRRTTRGRSTTRRWRNTTTWTSARGIQLALRYPALKRV